MTTEKRQTVGKLYYYYTPRKDAPPGTTNCSVKVPWIQMKGRWLNEAGFAIGTPIKVRVRPGCLVLTPVREDAHDDVS
ncbi:MAG: type I toxin-antitoxin system SymE family toxin [Candidatus Thiodiazotropha sp. (ex Epidulcina cf. delphinae)]|nr:type I toxin-antitoxin system SymE family toxin [Candidatus Thiodiazotropha sp. (ex Epidulcina cf. delphinae)]